jgi:hypothetical protein
MSVNLIRNARVFLTTNVSSSTRKVNSTGFSASNTFEIQVLDGLSFSQNTAAETVTISEAGDAPQRGQRSFNTTLEPVDWSFSTYLRPTWYEGTSDAVESLTAQDRVTAEEDCLWKAFASHNDTTFETGDVGPSGSFSKTWNEIVSNGSTPPYAWWNLSNSDKNQLIPFGLIIVFDNVSFLIHNCAIESVSVDFGIDAIATAAWTGRGALLERMGTAITFSADSTAPTASTPNGIGCFAAGFTGTAGTQLFRKKYTASRYIANKLSKLSLTSIANVFEQGTSVVYDFAITGGNITIANNLTYLTPATVGVVNQPFAYFTGTRTVTGNVTAYLRAGGTNTAGLISNFASQMVKDDENQFELSLGLGGSTAAEVANKVVFRCPRAMLQVPSISTDQIVSTTINFMPQSYDSTANTYSLNSANEVTVTYYSGPAL